MSKSLNHRLSLVAESTWGSTPATPTLEVLECTTAGGTINAPKQQSDTVRADANVKSSVPLNRSASFSRSQELVFPTVNEGLFYEIRAGLRTTEAAEVSTGTNGATATDTLALEAGGATITRSVGSFISDGYQPGDIIELENSTDDGFYRVSAVAATTLTLEMPDGAVFQTDTDVDITRGARMVNGVTDYSYTLEEANLDTQKMVTWTGQRVGSLSFGFTMGSKSNISISYVGKDGDPTVAMASASVGITGASYTDYTESPVFSPAQPIVVRVAGAVIPARSMSISIDTGARVRHSTSGGATPDAAPTGATRVRVSMSAYAAVLTQLTEHRAGTELATMMTMDDADGKTIGVTMGTVVWDTANVPMGGLDQDMMVTVNGVATLTEAVDANDQDSTIRFFRFA